MAHSPQDVYARHLASRRGYPLWTPEPNMNLPDVYIEQGLKIGDVGVVVPEDGSFDVFFNICLPHTHSLHRETGVPENFTPVLLGERDIAKFPEAESAGRIISTSSMVRVRDKDVPDEHLERPAQPGPLNYEFTLSSQEGAVLILPEGAERYYLRNERLFMDKATRHALDWYNFAEQRLGRIISYDSLYLITGFYKARSWSLAAYQQGAGAGDSGEPSAQFRAVQVGRGDITTSYTWETTHAMDWRVGPSDQYYHGFANQTVFIQGFKIAVREGIFRKRITVKADFPSIRTYHISYPRDSRFSHFLSGRTRSSSGSIPGAQPLGATVSSLNDEASDGGLFDVDHDVDDGMDEDIMIERFPHVAKTFHPCDIINEYLLQEVPSASVAVTHDSQWIALLDRELFDTSELSQAGRLIEAVKRNYSTALADEDVVYLQTTSMDVDAEGWEMMPAPRLSAIDAQHTIHVLAKPSRNLTAVEEYSDSERLPALDELNTTQSAVKMTPDPSSISPSKTTMWGSSYPPRIENRGTHDNMHKVTTACCNCEVRKIQCDRNLPDCTSCIRQGSPCSYVGVIKEKGKETDGSIPTSGSRAVRVVHSSSRPEKDSNVQASIQPKSSLERGRPTQPSHTNFADSRGRIAEAALALPWISSEFYLPTPPSALPSTRAISVTNAAPTSQFYGEPSDPSLNVDMFECLWTTGGTQCRAIIKGDRKSVASHLRDMHAFTCDGMTIPCAWGQCTAPMQRRNIPRHIVACHLEIRYECPLCRAILSRPDAIGKHRSVCSALKSAEMMEEGREGDNGW